MATSAQQEVAKNYHLTVHKEDEDQWISGEELRTDGSSDEEASSSKSKLMKKLRHRRINTAPSLLPSVLSEKEIRKSDNQSNRDNVRETLDLENKWRPKRGSLKLPSIASENLQQLKSNPEIEKLLQSVKDLTKQIDEITEKICVEQNERYKIQQEIYSVDDSDDEIKEKHEKALFLDVCQVLNSDGEDDVKLIENKRKFAKNPKFIERNIKLAKNTVMANLSLTDEEKQQLEQLLTNIDTFNEEISVENEYKINENDTKKIAEIDLNLKKFENDESKLEKEEMNLNMEEIDAKLQQLFEEDNRPIEEECENTDK